MNGSKQEHTDTLWLCGVRPGPALSPFGDDYSK